MAGLQREKSIRVCEAEILQASDLNRGAKSLQLPQGLIIGDSGNTN